MLCRRGRGRQGLLGTEDHTVLIAVLPKLADVGKQDENDIARMSAVHTMHSCLETLLDRADFRELWDSELRAVYMPKLRAFRDDKDKDVREAAREIFEEVDLGDSDEEGEVDSSDDDE